MRSTRSLNPSPSPGASRGPYQLLLEPRDDGVLGADAAQELPHVRMLLLQVREEPRVLAAVVELQGVAERQAVLAQLQPERDRPALPDAVPRELPYVGRLRPQPAAHGEQLPGDPALPSGTSCVRWRATTGITRAVRPWYSP